MYFVRSGNINLPHGSLWSAGYDGVFWSSVAYSADIRCTFGLGFDSANAYPSYNYFRYNGFSLCIFMTFPMYFVRSGNIYLPNGSLRSANYGGFFWANNPYPASFRYAFGFGLNPTIINPSTYFDRYYGFSLRFYNSPIYFVRSGYISLTYGSLQGANGEGIFQSSTAYPTVTQVTFGYDFNSMNIIPSNTYDHYLGYSLRALFPQTGYRVPTFPNLHPCCKIIKLGTLYPLYIFNHLSHIMSKPQFSPKYLHYFSMYFVRSGYIYLPKASINYASGSGTFWSATPTPLTDYNSSYLLFGAPRAYTSDSNVRFDGFSLSINHIIPLLSISSVVALSTFRTAHSGTQATLASSGHPSPTPLTFRTPSTSTSILLPPSPHITVIASTASPSNPPNPPSKYFWTLHAERH